MLRSKKFFKYNNTRYLGWINTIKAGKSYMLRDVHTITNPSTYVNNYRTSPLGWKFAIQAPVAFDDWKMLILPYRQ